MLVAQASSLVLGNYKKKKEKKEKSGGAFAFTAPCLLKQLPEYFRA